MEKLDIVMKALEGCFMGTGCDSCPYQYVECDSSCINDLLRDALETIRSLEKKYASAVEMAAIAEEQVAAAKKATKVARAERNAAWEKLARITGEREKVWLEEKPMTNDYGEYPPEFPREGM